MSGARQPSSSTDVVVVLSWETLADVHVRGWMRPPDRLTLGLAQDEQVGRLLVAEPFRSAVTSLARRGRRPVPVPAGSSSGRAVLSPRRLRRRDSRWALLNRRSYETYDRRLGEAAAFLRCERPVVITFSPFVAAYAPLRWAASCVYYARDDWSAHPEYERLWPALRDAQRAIKERGVAVAAVSQPLLDRLAPTGPGIVLPNGVDEEEWLTPTAPPDWFEALPRPRLVYAGSLDSRLDVDQVDRLAAGRPDISLVLAGPMKTSGAYSRLRARPNVHLPGNLPRSQLTAVLRDADAGLLLHRRNALTEAMDPLKLYEYLAAGKPVLATDLPPVSALREERVLLLQSGDDPLPALAKVLEMGEAPNQERLAFLREHSWRRRHGELLRLAVKEAT